MKKPYFKTVALSVALGVAATTGQTALGQDALDKIKATGKEKVVAGVKSQQRIDKLSDQTYDILQDYKTVNKQIEGLKVYNAQLEKQIKNQLLQIQQIEDSIEQVTVIERQITPLIIRMIDSLEQFVQLDIPFHKKEREERIAFLRKNLDRADLSVAEKFRQVLEAYKIENEYGRFIDSYTDTIDVDGRPREVNVLRVGRIALLFQTTDTEISGAWDQKNRQWVKVDRGQYRSAIMQGLRIAKKQAAIDVMNLPIPAPEAAQ